MDNKKKYIEVYSVVFDLDDEERVETLDSRESEKWTSFAHMKLVAALEKKFNILFEPQDIINFSSFKTGLEILKDKGIEI